MYDTVNLHDDVCVQASLRAGLLNQNCNVECWLTMGKDFRLVFNVVEQFLRGSERRGR